MSLSSSSSSNHSLLPPSNGVSLPFGLQCLIDEQHCLVFTIYTITNTLLLLPLSILVLYHGFRRRQQRCSSTTAATTSHSDIFTYHLVTMELIFVFGCVLCCIGSHKKDLGLLSMGFYGFTFSWYGETFFHVLTCVEHYLAVIHPVAYLSLRNERWIRIRNIVIGCIWLFCFGGSGLSYLDNISLVVLFSTLPLSLVIISFCCLSVLCALTRPRPGDQGRVDQSKQRAFCIILAILAVLLLRCAWNLSWSVLYQLKIEIGNCIVILSEVWFTFPSSLMLPLLFLQKIGTIRCFKTNMKQ